MSPAQAYSLRNAAEDSASLVLDGGYVERWVEGSIFPSEMAYFLATCDVQQVSNIIESGRQDGYSTEILGDWASRRPGRNVISIDLESEPERAAACRDRLAKWTSLDLVTGNAYAEFGRAAARLAKDNSRTTAFLVDGPKKAPAISMMVAAISDNVSVIASHNLIAGSHEYNFFHSLGGDEIFFEYAIEKPGPRWLELRERDLAQGSKNNSARSVDLSSIGVLTLDASRRAQVKKTSGLSYGLHQPWLIELLWQVGAYNLVPKVYGLSYKALGR